MLVSTIWPRGRDVVGENKESEVIDELVFQHE